MPDAFELEYSEDAIYVLRALAKSKNPKAPLLLREIQVFLSDLRTKGARIGTALSRDLKGYHSFKIGLGYLEDGGWRILYKEVAPNKIRVIIIASRPYAYDLVPKAE